MKIHAPIAQKFIRRCIDSVLALRSRIVRRWCQFLQLFAVKKALPSTILAVFCTLAAASRAAAQGCAMCYQNAAASGLRGGSTLRHAILILLLPAICLFLGIFGLIYSRRNSPR